MLAVTSLTARAQEVKGNLLQNSGFEDVAADGVKPAGDWYMNYGDAASRMTGDTGQAHTGDRCLKLSAPSLPGNNPSVSAEQVVPILPGHSYSFRAWVRSQRAGAEGLLAIVWSDKDHHWLTHSGLSFKYTDEWSIQRITGIAPKGAAYGAVRVDLRSVGTAWIDDASLIERKVVKLEPQERSGVITAKATCSLHWRTLDVEGFPVSGAKVDIKVLGGDIAFTPGSATNRTITSDDAGLVSASVRAAARPGVTCSVTATCDDAVNRLELRTATIGTPTRYRVDPINYAPQPGQPIQVRVRLLGAYNEPVSIPGRRINAKLTVGKESASGSLGKDGSSYLTLKTPGSLFDKFTVSVRDTDGIAGESLALVVSPPMRKDLIRVGRNGYFVHAVGKPFLPFGGLYGNWIHKVQGKDSTDLISTSFVDATDEQLKQWFAYLQANGVTALRGMLRDHVKKGTEPMDIIGAVNEPLLKRWEHMMSLARPYGIRFLLTLHESWYATYAAYFNQKTLDDCVLPRYTAEQLNALPAYRRRFLVEKRMLMQTSEPMTDPDVLACQRDYLTELIPRLRSNPDIFAYEIENEQPDGYMDWTNAQIEQIRRYDALTPICVSHLGSGLLDADPVPWSRNTGIDFYTYHIYPFGLQTSAERDYGTAVAITARYSALGKPAMAGESFGDEWYKSTPEARHLGARDCIWSQILSHNVGAFFWNTSDEPIKEFRLAQKLAERAGIGSFKPAPARVGINVSPYMNDDRRFQLNDGKKLFVDMSLRAAECFKRGVNFDFTFKPGVYPISIRPTDTNKIATITPEVETSEGWETQYVRSQDGGRFLCYIRNVDKIVQIQEDRNSGWTRSRKPVELTIKLRIPLRAKSITVVDLDTGAEHALALKTGIPLNLGVTEHDYALLARE